MTNSRERKSRSTHSEQHPCGEDRVTGEDQSMPDERRQIMCARRCVIVPKASITEKEAEVERETGSSSRSFGGSSRGSRSSEKAFLVRGLVADIVSDYPIPHILDSLGQNALTSQPRPHRTGQSQRYFLGFDASTILACFPIISIDFFPPGLSTSVGAP